MRRTLLFIAVYLFCTSACTCWGVGLPPNTQIRIIASADYTNSLNEFQSADPASVVLMVLQVAGARIDWYPQSGSTVRGNPAYIPIKITNTGNGSDTFDLTAVSNNGWTTYIIKDEDADGVKDPEDDVLTTDTQLIPDGYCRAFVQVNVPNNTNNGDTITIQAVSRTSPTTGIATEQATIAPPGKSSTKLTLVSVPAAPVAGQTLTISGTISPVVAGLPIDITTTDAQSNSSSVSLTTSADGSFQTTCATTAAGVYHIQASFSGNNFYSSSAESIDVTVIPKISTSLTCDITPASPAVGDNITVSGSLTPSIETQVTITCHPPSGDPTALNAKTDKFGRYLATTTVGSAGSWTVTTAFAGDVTHLASSINIAFQVNPQPQEHSIEFTSPAQVNPSTVSVGEATKCSAAAQDSLGHSLIYQWSDGSSGGTFSPSADIASPTYLPAANNTAQNITVTLTCTAKCNDDPTVAAVSKADLTLKSKNDSVPAVLAVSPQPASNVDDLSSDVIIKFSKAMNQAQTQAAVSFAPMLNGVIASWDSTKTILTLTHTAFQAGTSYTCTISTSARDESGNALSAAYSWSFTTVSLLRFDPSEIGSLTQATFSTPNIIVCDPTQPTTVSFKVKVPAGIIMDSSVDGSGNLVCVKKGIDAGNLTSSWNAATREISISSDITNPSVSAELVKAIRLATSTSTGKFQVQLQGVPKLDVNVGNIAPGDFNGDGVVNIVDAMRFTGEWARWQANPAPVYDTDIDDPFDLAPHTAGIWPNWTRIGNHAINMDDLTAFQECWTTAHSLSLRAPANLTGKQTTLGKVLIQKYANKDLSLVIEKSCGGLFSVEIPVANNRFDPTVGPDGNLVNVNKEQDAGTILFSEYDPVAKAIRITGLIDTLTQKNVATIRFGK